jgi:hypothetical protein
MNSWLSVLLYYNPERVCVLPSVISYYSTLWRKEKVLSFLVSFYLETVCSMSVSVPPHCYTYSSSQPFSAPWLQNSYLIPRSPVFGGLWFFSFSFFFLWLDRKFGGVWGRRSANSISWDKILLLFCALAKPSLLEN